MASGVIYIVPLLFPSHASATGYLSTMNLDEMDEETRATITVKEIWL